MLMHLTAEENLSAAGHISNLISPQREHKYELKSLGWPRLTFRSSHPPTTEALALQTAKIRLALT